MSVNRLFRIAATLVAVLGLLSACNLGQQAPPQPTEQAPLPPAPTPVTPAATEADPTSLEDTASLIAFKDQLVAALNANDFATLETLMFNGLSVMGDPEGLFPAEVAMSALQSTYRASGAPVQELGFGYFDYDAGAWVGPTFEDVIGYDVQACCGSSVLVAGAVHVNGWGADGTGEAVLILVDAPLEGVGFVWEGFHDLSGTPVPESGQLNTIEGFMQAVQEAVIAKDFELMALMMSSPFTIAAWQAGGGEWTPIEAASNLTTTQMTPDATIAFSPPDTDIRALLSGQDPVGFLGPDKNVVAVMHSTGWGTDGTGEALLFIVQSPEGTFAWDTIVLAATGF